jgi:hypothetical protein
MSNLLNQLISEFQSREERGFKKYGTTMDRTDLSFNEWLQHFKEELMDGLLYLQKIQNDQELVKVLTPVERLQILEPLCDKYRKQSRAEIEKDIIEFSRRKGIPRIKTDY